MSTPSMEIVSRYAGMEFTIFSVVSYDVNIETPKTSLAKTYDIKNEMTVVLEVPKIYYTLEHLQILLKWIELPVYDKNYYRDFAVHVSMVGNNERTILFTHATVSAVISTDTNADFVTIELLVRQKEDKFYATTFGEKPDDTYAAAKKRLANPPRLNIYVPSIKLPNDVTVMGQANPNVEFAAAPLGRKVDTKTVNMKTVPSTSIIYEGYSYTMKPHLLMYNRNKDQIYYQLDDVLKIFNGKIYAKNSNGLATSFTIETVDPIDNSTNDRKPNTLSISINYQAVTSGSRGVDTDAHILQNEKDKKLYISIDYVLEVVSGINGYKAILTKDNVLYCTFPTGRYKGNNVGYFENNKYYVYDGYQMIRPIIYINHKFSKLEVLNGKLSNIAIGASPFLSKIVKNASAAGSLGEAATLFLIAINASKAVYEYEAVDVGSIGGIYYRLFYARKIIDKITENANVPVPYKPVYIELFYDSPEMNTIVYIEVTGELSNVYESNW